MSNLNEIWRKSLTLDDFSVSNLGRVRNDKTNHIRKPQDNGNGYLQIGVKIDGKLKQFYIHRLVAEAFIPNPENKPQVNHLDYNKYNCAASNLEWTTAKENLNYSYDNIFTEEKRENARKRLINLNSDPEFVKKRDEALEKLHKDPSYIAKKKELGKEMYSKYLSTPEIRKRTVEASRKANMKSVEMYNLETGTTIKNFTSIIEAGMHIVNLGLGKNINSSKSAISNCLRGKTSKAFEFGWRYKTA